MALCPARFPLPRVEHRETLQRTCMDPNIIAKVSKLHFVEFDFRVTVSASLAKAIKENLKQSFKPSKMKNFTKKLKQGSEI